VHKRFTFLDSGSINYFLTFTSDCNYELDFIGSGATPGTFNKDVYGIGTFAVSGSILTATPEQSSCPGSQAPWANVFAFAANGDLEYVVAAGNASVPTIPETPVWERGQATLDGGVFTIGCYESRAWTKRYVMTGEGETLRPSRMRRSPGIHEVSATYSRHASWSRPMKRSRTGAFGIIRAKRTIGAVAGALESFLHTSPGRANGFLRAFKEELRQSREKRGGSAQRPPRVHRCCNREDVRTEMQKMNAAYDVEPPVRQKFVFAFLPVVHPA
jgi:hypothetical protein